MVVTTGTDDSGTLTGVANQKYRKEVNEFTDPNGNSETRTYYFNDDRLILVALMPMQLMPRIQALVILGY